MKTAMAFGTFDILHPSPLFYLNFAKKKADKLIVVISRDESVIELKKHEPHFHEKERLKLVSSLKMVNLAVLGDKKDFMKVVQKHHPDVLVLGYDHSITESELKKMLQERNLSIPIVRAAAHKPEKHKSTIYRDKIVRRKTQI